MALQIEQLDFSGRLALGDSRLEYDLVIDPLACGSFPWLGFITSRKREMSWRVDFLNGTNVCAVKPLLPVNCSRSADRTLASLSGAFCDSDLQIKLHRDVRPCRYLQPWLSGKADADAGSLLLSFQMMCSLCGLPFDHTGNAQ